MAKRLVSRHEQCGQLDVSQVFDADNGIVVKQNFTFYIVVAQPQVSMAVRLDSRHHGQRS